MKHKQPELVKCGLRHKLFSVLQHHQSFVSIHVHTNFTFCIRIRTDKTFGSQEPNNTPHQHCPEL